MELAAMEVITPASLDEALDLLARFGPEARPLAGGTDAMVRVKEGQWRVPRWIHIRKLPELNCVAHENGCLSIGAAVPYSRLLRDPRLLEAAPLLLDALRQVGAAQIQAMGTLGGNLGTASPAGDALPPLYALEAEVGLRSTRGQRWVPVEQFVLGPGATLRQPDELITAVRFAPQPPGERWRWQKLGLRGAQAISVVSLAMRVQCSPTGTATAARFAFGAVGPTVLRARRCEQALVHAGATDETTLRSIGQLAWNEVLPISDVRASAEYRRQMAAALLQRGLLALLRPGEGWA